MSRREEMLFKNTEFVGYSDLNKKPGFQMGMHRTKDGRYYLYTACFRDNGFNIVDVTDPANPVANLWNFEIFYLSQRNLSVSSS